MTLSEIRTRLQDFYGSDQTEDATRLNRFINDAYRELAAVADWWWLETHEILRLSAPVTALSVGVNLGTADIVPSGTAYVGTAYALGWCAAGDRTFRVNAVAASSPYTITLDANWPTATATVTVQLWNDTLTLAADCDFPVALAPRNDPNHALLQHVDLRDIEARGPDLSNTETTIASQFATFREPVYTSARLRIRFFPPPDDVSEYVCRYRAYAAEMSTDTASTLIPVKHEQTLVALATLKLAKYYREDPEVVSYWADEYNRCLAAMYRDQNRHGHQAVRAGRRGVAAAASQPFRLVNVELGGI